MKEREGLSLPAAILLLSFLVDLHCCHTALIQPRLASDLLCSPGWPWPCVSPASASPGLRLQAGAPSLKSNRSEVFGFVWALAKWRVCRFPIYSTSSALQTSFPRCSALLLTLPPTLRGDLPRPAGFCISSPQPSPPSRKPSPTRIDATDALGPDPLGDCWRGSSKHSP